MSAEQTVITQRDIALDFASKVQEKLIAAGIKTARFGLFDDAHQIAVGVEIDGQRVAEKIRVGAADEVVDDVVKTFADLIRIKAETYLRTTTRRQRQNAALRMLTTD